jgi:hypothetical protein
MISDLPTAVLGESLAAEDTLLKLSKGGEAGYLLFSKRILKGIGNQKKTHNSEVIPCNVVQFHRRAISD